MSTKTVFLLVLSAILIAAVFSLDPIAQDPSYHNFADTRTVLGLPNFWNVLSNFPFLLIGGFGIYLKRSRNSPGIVPGLHLAYVVFFAGIFLTGVGSAYYHYAPSNDTLVWDRLPMTLGFMGLVTIIVGEFVSLTAAKRLLIPLLIVGALSVIYWSMTEGRGAGDLRPYAIVQFLPMLLVPVILLVYRSIYDSVTFLWLVVALYALSKLFEQFDLAIYDVGHLISGHSIKHVVAATAALVFLHGLDNRRLVGEDLAA